MTERKRHKKILGTKLANLLLHPYFLIPTTICNFFNKADKFIKDQDELGGENAIRIRQFKKKLNRRAKRQRIVGRNGNWKLPLIANGHLLILTTRYINGKAAKSPTPYMSRWVIDLLTVIRHKHEHFRDFPDAERQTLGWFTIPEGVTIDQMYAQYWLTLYPRLLPFLWKEFYRFRNESSLMEFYSGFNNSPRLKLALKVEQLLKNIDDALTDDLHNGHLEETFVACSINLKLEIRNLSSVRISNILSKSTSVLAISISDNGMKVLWKVVSMKPLEYGCNMNANLKNCVLLITNNCSKIDTNILKHCVGFEKVIVLTSDDNAKLAITHKLKEKLNIEFSENPFSWADINESAYNTIFCKPVRVQGRKVSLKEILPICESSNQTVLSKLKGSTFVKLLRNETPTLFDKCKEPNVLPTYVKRKLLKRVVVGSDILSSETVLDSDILIVCGVSFETLKRLVGKNRKLLKIEINPGKGKYEFPDELDAKILVIENTLECSTDIFNSLKNKTWFNDSNVHCFQYNNDQTLVWFGTQGNVSILKEFIDKKFKVEDLKFFGDDELPNSISVNDRLVCICDKSGMGKSVILPKLGQSILLEPPNRLVCLLEITKFLEKVQNKAPDSNSGIRAILNLICDTEFEIELATAWLNENETGSIRLEIMFDGLDELDLEKSKNVFTTAIKQITENFSSVRVWVTLRDHLAKQMQDKLDAIYLKMLPFSTQEKVECLVRNWKEYIEENKSYVEVLPNDSELEAFANKCATIEIFSENVDIAAVPLQCFMIAQVHAENALQRHFRVDLRSSQTITSLYETVIEQKFKLYLRRTGCGELSPDNHMYQDNYQTMLQRHFYYSLKLIVSADVAEWFRNTFCISIPNTAKFCNNIFAYGIIVNLDEPRFLHRTFAEYLVALFLFEVLAGNHEDVISQTDSDFQNVLWNEALEMYDGVITWYPNFKKPAIASFLNSFLNSVVNPTPDLLLNSENENKSRIKCQNLRVDVKSINWMANCFHANLSYDLEFGYVYELVLTSRLPFRNLYYMALRCDQHTFCNQAIINSHLVHLRTRQHDVDLSLKIEWKINKKGEGMKLIQEFYNAIFPSVLNEKVCPNCNIFEWIALSFSKQNKEDAVHLIEVRPTLAMKQLLQHLHKNGQIQEDQLEKVNVKGRTPLHELVENGDMRNHDVVEWIDFYITTLKANVYVKDRDGHSLLHSLVINVSDNFKKAKENPDLYLKVWQLLVKNGCIPLDANFQGNTPFHLEMNWCGTNKWLVFFYEIEHFPEVVHTLEQHGNSILMVSLWKRSCNLEIIQKLISLGSDVNLRNNMGKTPILLTVENDREDLYHLLKASGADDTVYDLHGNGTLHYAARSGSLKMWQILEKHHLDVKQVNKKSQNILHMAVEYHRHNVDCKVSLVECILEKYPSLIEAVDGEGNCILHYAIMTKCKNILRVVLSTGAYNILQQNNDGYAPLHLSLKVENLGAISTLLKSGADFYQLNKNKECAVYIALQNNNCNILEELLSLESKYNYDQECQCNLHLYARHNESILNRLLDNFESTPKPENLCFQCKADIVKECKCGEKLFAIFYLWCKMEKSEKEKLCSTIISMLIKSSKWQTFSTEHHWGCRTEICHKKEIIDKVSQMNLKSEMTTDKSPTKSKKQLRYNPKLGKFEIVDG